MIGKNPQSPTPDLPTCPPNSQSSLPLTFTRSFTTQPSELSPHSFSILQLNCHNRKDTTYSVLHTESSCLAILLQEPWTNPIDHLPPTHTGWHRVTPIDQPSSIENRPRCCIYINKSIPSHHFHRLPNNSKFLTAASLTVNTHTPLRFAIISLYNPPFTFSAIPTLRDWLNSHNCRHTPTVLMMDSNLHNPRWNPPNYHHTHSASKDLIKLCGQKGYTLASPAGIPTFANSRGAQTTIDLCWINAQCKRRVQQCKVALNNHASDHQPIHLAISLEGKIHHPPSNRGLTPDRVDNSCFVTDLEQTIKSIPLPHSSDSIASIDAAVSRLTKGIQHCHKKQGTKPWKGSTRSNSWWVPHILDPLVKNRNRARRWMILSNSEEARHCYYAWQKEFKQKVEELKLLHWRRFLARTGDASAFQAYKFTKARQTTTVEPLYKPDKSLCTDVTEQAEMLFKGTSVIHSTCDLSDILPRHIDTTPPSFPPVTPAEVNRAIDSLPAKKAVGPDLIPNELLKMGKAQLTPFLTPLFNACLRHGHFPREWRTAVTAILRKAGKPDYSDPNAYRPIALLCTLGKLFEKILNERLLHWIETKDILPQGHMGGRRGRNLTDALIVFTSWVKHQWRKGKIVAGLFLDVKSAYPSVYTSRLIDHLHQLSCPGYLIPIISSFLSNQTTSMRLGDFVSSTFLIKEGLPQGSPLSVTLYILYNSGLLFNKTCMLDNHRISIGYVDDVVHLVAATSMDQAISLLQEEASRSLAWGRKFGAIFDPKKAVTMLFSCKTLTPPTFDFDGHTLSFQKSTRWLGIILDQRLTFSEHLKKVKSTGDLTIRQLERIAKSTYGLNTRLTRKLVISVLYSRILFGSIIWFNKKNAKSVAQVLDGLYHRACRLITGLFRQTPLVFVRKSSGLSSPVEIHIRNSHFYILRALTYPLSHPVLHIVKTELTTRQPSFPSPVHLLMTPTDQHSFPAEKMESIHPVPAPPWTKPISTILNSTDKRAEALQRIPQQLQQEIQNQTLVIFSDGSWIPEKGAGAAAVVHPSGASIAARLDPAESISNFETELIGIRLAMHMAQEVLEADLSCYYTDIAIFSDNQGALLRSADPISLTPGQYLYADNFFHMKLLGRTIRLYWCPGHEGIEANEKANTLAKTAALGEPLPDNCTLRQQKISTSLAMAKQIRRRQLKIPEALSDEDTRRFAFSKDCTKLLQTLDTQEKGLAAVILQLRADTAPLNNFLFKIKSILDPRCTNCFVVENAAHFLMFCSRYRKDRAILKRQLRLLKCRVNPNSFRSIMDNPKAMEAVANFILSTNRFPNIKKYGPTTEPP
ncbi:hypothetical protein PGTUg99_050034 [Puccinia graminis f. sp. tritici]|uniref:Reverse transcriptase domain-containing protein n=1 Tax=Puccinia graminis f. sp. tritici TaxID=56615 RepID=A0A5B0RXE8_PUCGR|nr:hypothetical protein PGTUg99_050034 [Puccinia graminis f. sp. tritici]